MIIETNLPRLLGASAITIWPVILIAPGLDPNLRQMVLTHERVHLVQQRRWAVYGLGVGLLAWFFLYLFCLPVAWNPWRRKWETEAYRADGYSDAWIKRTLRLAPYWLT